MIHAGTDLKYMVTVSMNGFDINEDDMELVIKNRWGQVKYKYKAEDFFSDGEGHWFFTMENVASGIYYAFLSCWRGDEDFKENYQRVTDVRKLVSVGICDCHSSMCECGETEGMEVSYERVWTVNFIDGIYLADCNGVPIRDVNGELIRFSDKVPEQKDVRISMTAAEFKHYWDEKDENGVIDTRREMEDLLKGFPENTEMGVMSSEDTDDMMSRILGN